MLRFVVAFAIVAFLAATAACSDAPSGPSQVGLGISAVTPNTGPAAGGTTVTITGHGYLASVQVRFGTAPAASVQIVNSTTLTAITSPHNAGVVDVLVHSGGASTALTGAFTYVP
jgi:hypothetical protein